MSIFPQAPGSTTGARRPVRSAGVQQMAPAGDYLRRGRGAEDQRSSRSPSKNRTRGVVTGCSDHAGAAYAPSAHYINGVEEEQEPRFDPWSLYGPETGGRGPPGAGAAADPRGARRNAESWGGTRLAYPRIGYVSDQFQSGFRPVSDQCPGGFAEFMSQCHFGCRVQVIVSRPMHSHVGCTVSCRMHSVMSDMHLS